MNDLTGKTILVTGAASGIGQATAARCAAAGATIIGADLNAPADGGLGEPHRFVQVDVSDDASVANLISEAAGVDGLVNAAGISIPGGLQHTTRDNWNKILDVNLTGTMAICQGVTAAMVEAGRSGSVVNVSSAYGLTGGSGNVAYNVSKSGVAQLTRCMAADLGGNGIRVNAVCPGYIETPMTTMLENAGAFRDHFVAMHLLKRPGAPEEVAAVINFLLSDDASYVSGALLPVDGGFTAAHVPILG